MTLPQPASVTSPISSSGTIVNFAAPDGPVSVNIPAGAFSVPLNLTIVQPSTYPTITASAGGSATGTGVGIQVTLDQPVQPDQNVTLSISYAGSNLSAFNPAKLVICRYDPTENVWVPLPSTPDPVNRRVVATTEHFSLFQIMSISPAANLSNPKVFPNPFRPALGHTRITFSNLPANAMLRIYDILGEKVRDLTTNASGIASWDSKNSNGNNVASGVYFVLAGSGSSRTTFKVAIQR